MLQVEAENAIALMNGQWLGRFGRFKKKTFYISLTCSAMAVLTHRLVRMMVFKSSNPQPQYPDQLGDKETTGKQK